jgi:D-alanyl-D-alanine carboxypeptidase
VSVLTVSKPLPGHPKYSWLPWSAGTPYLACAILATVLAAGPPASPPSYPPPPAGVAAEIRAEASVADGLGVSVAVSRGAQLEWAGGFGSADLATKLPASAATVFQIGSITKTFTAALVMQLAQEGDLSLADHIGQFVPGLPWGNKVTIAELLSHTSGIVDYVNSMPSMLGPDCPLPSGSVADCPALTPGPVVHWLGGHALMFPPGTQFSYSNSNYYLLGLVIERVTGQSYAAYLERRIIAPLGLSHTGPCPDQMAPPTDAVGYLLPIGAPLLTVTGSYPFDSEAFAAGELCSTVGDLVKWANDLAHGRVVSARTYKEMTTPPSLPGGFYTSYGYGLMVDQVDGQAFVGHDGATLGFLCGLYHFSGLDLNVAICTNANGPLGNVVIQNIVGDLVASR